MTVEVRRDYISREQVLKKLQALENEYHKEFLRNDTSAVYEMNMWGRMHGIEKACELVLELPSVEVPIGKWIDVEGYEGIVWECSKCKQLVTHKFNYCPNCGADMRESEVNT